MKKLLFTTAVFLLCGYLYAQDTVTKDKKSKVYFSFNIGMMDLELHSYSSQLRIDTESFGWNDWDTDELDEFNSLYSSTQLWTSSNVGFAYNILNNSQSKWNIDIGVELGIPTVSHIEKDRADDEIQLEFTQKGINYSLGLFADIDYHINEDWTVIAQPLFSYASCNSDMNSYTYSFEGSYKTEYETTFSSIYPRLNIMGGYHVKNFRIKGGLGLYYYSSSISIDITKKTDLQSFLEEKDYEMTSKTNLDALLGFDWSISDAIEWSLFASGYQNITIRTVLSYKF
ncbi:MULTISPECIES: hypothetical protein [unclassified Lentimicrobium]|uniref:hypothetical protein n=1 Tax=unclassified Lentimicrobium TaxID=2677434 RepID=UPI001557B61C|nr:MULTISPECIES: hypothetical protein [unclassified Lentimicrobium]NPD45845.1 hypothetical protein [Lentimicrobium sp. S6]NPD86597.1 hypothetical protein [Lentimicrobium sp. L6]